MSLGPPVGSGYLLRCETCDGDGKWYLLRRGDAVCSWACGEHVSDALERMQRDHEITQIVVRHQHKMNEWHELAELLRPN